jgi:hypothetical protein
MTKTWNAIAREAGFAAEHIGIGVTALGKANYAFPAYYGQAFLALSVGFERSCKLAIIVDHALQNGGHFPEEKVVRKYKHNLKELLAQCDQISEARYPSVQRMPNSEIHKNIIEILSDFADNVTRYYNIQVITGGSFSGPVEDPLKQWQRRVVEPILETKCNAASIAQVIEQAELLEQATGSFTFVLHTSEDGSPLDSVRLASTRSGLTRLSTPYVRLHVLQIARSLAQLHDQLGTKAQELGMEDIPYLLEFFQLFTLDDAYLKSRKNWSTYPRYPAF